MGWTVPDLGQAELVLAQTPEALIALAEAAPNGVEHIFQGFRGAGHLAAAYQVLGRRRAPFWVLLESLDDTGLRGRMRRVYYHRMLRTWRNRLRGVLAIGADAPAWMVRHGMPAAKVVPFAYFLPDTQPRPPVETSLQRQFHVMYVGQLIQRKGLDVLLDALTQTPWGLRCTIVGSGPEEAALQARAEALGLNQRITWAGTQKIDDVPGFMARADILVLPSHFDGWGAVVTEALMAGTPALTTHRCGAAEAVRASGLGGVVPAGDAHALAMKLTEAAARGPLAAVTRTALAAWAQNFGAAAGASYLEAVLDRASASVRPTPPWRAITPLDMRKTQTETVIQAAE